MGGRTWRTARKSPIQPTNIVVAPQDPLGLIPEVHVQALGLIRSRGHFPKGGYDVPDGATNQESAPTPAV